MARIRTVKPEFWTDSFMVQLPPIARLIYIALWTAADDHGYIKDEVDRLAMEVMPREDREVFDDWVQLFIASERLQTFVDDNNRVFYRVAKWDDHQRIDKPSKSRIFREGSRKLAIPSEVRRQVAIKYGCEPGNEITVNCFYCGSQGRIHWHKLYNGRPSSWVTFPSLELEHLIAEREGGENVVENIVLACRNCNRSKGTKHWVDALCSKSDVTIQRLAMSIPEDSRNIREDSLLEQGTGKGKEQGKEQGSVASKKQRASFVKPTLQELQEFTAENKLSVDPQYFLDHYNGNGWKVGSAAMKDWQATVRNWHRRNIEKKTNQTSSFGQRALEAQW